MSRWQNFLKSGYNGKQEWSTYVHSIFVPWYSTINCTFSSCPGLRFFCKESVSIDYNTKAHRKSDSGVRYLRIVTSSGFSILRSLGSLKVCLLLRGLSCMPSSNGTSSHGSLGTVTRCSFSLRLKHSDTSSSNCTCNTVTIYISLIHYTIIMSAIVYCLRCTWYLDNLRTEGTAILKGLGSTPALFTNTKHLLLFFL